MIVGIVIGGGLLIALLDFLLIIGAAKLEHDASPCNTCIHSSNEWDEAPCDTCDVENFHWEPNDKE